MFLRNSEFLTDFPIKMIDGGNLGIKRMIINLKEE